MVDHLAECFNTQVPVANGFVPVLMALKRIFCVVDMDCLQPVQANHFIKCFQHPVCIVFYVIAGIKDMARVHAYAQPVAKIDTVNNCPDFLKSSADLTAFTGHGFEQD